MKLAGIDTKAQLVRARNYTSVFLWFLRFILRDNIVWLLLASTLGLIPTALKVLASVLAIQVVANQFTDKAASFGWFSKIPHLGEFLTALPFQQAVMMLVVLFAISALLDLALDRLTLRRMHFMDIALSAFVMERLAWENLHGSIKSYPDGPERPDLKTGKGPLAEGRRARIILGYTVEDWEEMSTDERRALKIEHAEVIERARDEINAQMKSRKEEREQLMADYKEAKAGVVTRQDKISSATKMATGDARIAAIAFRILFRNSPNVISAIGLLAFIGYVEPMSIFALGAAVATFLCALVPIAIYAFFVSLDFETRAGRAAGEKRGLFEGWLDEGAAVKFREVIEHMRDHAPLNESITAFLRRLWVLDVSRAAATVAGTVVLVGLILFYTDLIKSGTMSYADAILSMMCFRMLLRNGEGIMVGLSSITRFYVNLRRLYFFGVHGIFVERPGGDDDMTSMEMM